MVPCQLLLKTTGITHVEFNTKFDVYSVSTCGREEGRRGEGERKSKKGSEKRERERERRGMGGRRERKIVEGREREKEKGEGEERKRRGMGGRGGE